jgi:hypothetical protein
LTVAEEPLANAPTLQVTFAPLEQKPDDEFAETNTPVDGTSAVREISEALEGPAFEMVAV